MDCVMYQKVALSGDQGIPYLTDYKYKSAELMLW